MKALSIRQPWAHLIIHGGKDIENRTWTSDFRGEFLIHASSIMTRADYEACVIFCSGLPGGTLPEDFWFPTFDELKTQLGGIVGTASIFGCVAQDDSPWVCGPYGFRIENAKALPFTPCKGRLGFFNPQVAMEVA